MEISSRMDDLQAVDQRQTIADVSTHVDTSRDIVEMAEFPDHDDVFLILSLIDITYSLRLIKQLTNTS